MSDATPDHVPGTACDMSDEGFCRTHNRQVRVSPPEPEWLWPGLLPMGERTFWTGESLPAPKRIGYIRIINDATGEVIGHYDPDHYRMVPDCPNSLARVHTHSVGPLCEVAGHDCAYERFLDDPITRAYGVSDMIGMISCAVCDSLEPGAVCTHRSCEAIVHSGQDCTACQLESIEADWEARTHRTNI